jgi:hypothetical protein
MFSHGSGVVSGFVGFPASAGTPSAIKHVAHTNANTDFEIETMMIPSLCGTAAAETTRTYWSFVLRTARLSSVTAE